MAPHSVHSESPPRERESSPAEQPYQNGVAASSNGDGSGNQSEQNGNSSSNATSRASGSPTPAERRGDLKNLLRFYNETSERGRRRGSRAEIENWVDSLPESVLSWFYTAVSRAQPHDEPAQKRIVARLAQDTGNGHLAEQYILLLLDQDYQIVRGSPTEILVRRGPDRATPSELWATFVVVSNGH